MMSLNMRNISKMSKRPKKTRSQIQVKKINQSLMPETKAKVSLEIILLIPKHLKKTTKNPKMTIGIMKPAIKTKII